MVGIQSCLPPFDGKDSQASRDDFRFTAEPYRPRTGVDESYDTSYDRGVDHITASKARERLYRLLGEVAASREPVLITGRRASAVLVSEQDWRSIQETLCLDSIPGMRESIREGLATPVSKCASHLKW
jgi:prevent-host-death family protein